MKKEHSGNVYKIPLDFDFGFVYGEVLDFSDISPFDGILVQVFNHRDLDAKTSPTIDTIKSSEVFFGPVPVNKYPSVKGQNSWKLLGKSDQYQQESPYFKRLRGILKYNDWSKLEPWFKVKAFDTDPQEIQCDYEDIRRLEGLILNHLQMVPIKVTMIVIINQNLNVWDFYNVKDTGMQNIFVQVVNTYFDKQRCEKLLKSI